jgi:hypothetical protein
MTPPLAMHACSARKAAMYARAGGWWEVAVLLEARVSSNGCPPAACTLAPHACNRDAPFGITRGHHAGSMEAPGWRAACRLQCITAGGPPAVARAGVEQQGRQ